MLWANSADDQLVPDILLILFFYQKTGFDISGKLSPIQMYCQILFSGKKIWKYSMLSPKNFIQSAKH